METKMYRMDLNGSGRMAEIGKVVLEVGQRVYGFLGYGGSESGTFIVVSKPDEHGKQLMAEIGGQHRFSYWMVGEDDQPLSKKFGIGYYWDDSDPGYRMPAGEMAKLIHQCEVQKAWDKRLERNEQIASQKRMDALREEYGTILAECKNYDTRTAKQNMLALLKHAFPGVKFRCHKNGYRSYALKWTDGPSRGMVEEICSPFVDTTFNGYEDCQEYIHTEFNSLYGGIGYMPDMEREYSGAVWNAAKEKFYATHPEAVGLEENKEFTPETYSDFVKGLNWPCAESCIHNYLWDVNLCQKPEEKTEGTSPKNTGSENGLQLIDYSEKAVAIIGNTRNHVDKLKELGGRFNGKLKCGAGWIFPKKREAEIRAAFAL